MNIILNSRRRGLEHLFASGFFHWLGLDGGLVYNILKTCLSAVLVRSHKGGCKASVLPQHNLSNQVRVRSLCTKGHEAPEMRPLSSRRYPEGQFVLEKEGAGSTNQSVAELVFHLAASTVALVISIWVARPSVLLVDPVHFDSAGWGW